MRHLSNIDANKQPKRMPECLRGDWAVGTSSFNGVFLKICPYDPTSKIQKIEIESNKTFMQNKLKICKTDFLQNWKMWFFAYFKNS